VEACAARGVTVLTLRRRANIACAEHVMALMLALAKRIHQLDHVVTADTLDAGGYPYRPFDRRHTPKSNFGRIGGIRVLAGSTIGIVGFGEIGREVALRANAFGMRVLYYQRTALPAAEERALNVAYALLHELMAQSDWIVPALPGGSGAKHVIDAAALSHVKSGAMIANVSRADAVEREALIDALKSGRLGGLGLDPLYDEPMRPDDELLKLDNVILTPHIAAQPRANALRDMEEMLDGLARALA
jgi:lactate dehydrogenase-like 2-hydroxyacid dehydrogenase